MMARNNNYEWNNEQMIENANKWSLAGDVALLTRLKKFSETLLFETESISTNVDTLLNNLDDVALRLDLTKNEFQSLRNTQFIENRVYEDDETLDNTETKKANIEVSEDEKEKVLKESIATGLKVMQKYFDRVELAVSDSEEENEMSYVLQPKDPYIDRPLPYLVGSQDWYKKWHVGLQPSDSESESEQEQEKYSSTDSEDELPKDRILGSETSSELDFVGKNAGPAANSTFNDTEDHRREVFHSSSESEGQNGSLSVQTPISNKNFAEQLAERLGNVMSGNVGVVEDVNRNPIKKMNHGQSYVGNLFSDEPPPLDDLDDTILPKSTQKGLFFGGEDLFGKSDEEDLFWGHKSDASKNMSPTNKEKPIGTATKGSDDIKSKVTLPTISRGLFDESNTSSSEDDMFLAVEKRKTTAAPYLKPFQTTAPIFDNQPPEIFPKSDNSVAKKKPIGGVSIFGRNSDIFAEVQSKQRLEGYRPEDSSEKTEEIKDNIEETGSKVTNLLKDAKKPLKKLGLFDESSDEETIRPKKEEKKTKSSITKLSLFDDTLENEELVIPKNEEIQKSEANHTKEQSSDNVSAEKEDPNVKEKKPAKKISLFDDDDDDFLKEEEDIFAGISKKKNLFDDLDTVPSKKSTKAEGKSNLFDKNCAKNEEDKELIRGILSDKHEVIGKNDEIGVMKTDPDLFEDNIEITNEDIFGPSGEKRNADEEYQYNRVAKEENGLKQEKTEIPGKIKKNVSLFDSSGEEDDFDEDIFSSKDDIKDKEELETKKQKESEEKVEKEIVLKEEIEEESNEKEQAVVEQETDNSVKEEKADDIPQLFEDVATTFNGDKKKPMQADQNPVLESPTTEREAKKHTSSVQQIEDPHVKVTEATPEDKAPFSFNISTVPPPLSLFDPTPPPDLDWDQRSDDSDVDTFSITDGLLDHQDFGQSQHRSSLFDNEPPSLNANESSGIVRDMNVTSRVETDDSSFYPYASSSRRLSSDIFGDQQNQDSFFVTKNRTESVPQSASLGIISENTTKIDNLTPSGNLEDFLDSSVFQKSANASKVNENMEEIKKPDNLEKPDKNEASPNKGSPGKLKHNLTINVEALLPGAVLPKSRTVVKSISLEEPEKAATQMGVTTLTPPLLGVVKPVSGLGGVTSSEPDKTDSLGSEVLHSVTKDRARIPVKRRPSTRKGRQEAIRKSMTDFTLYKNEENVLGNEDGVVSESETSKVESESLTHVALPVDSIKKEDPGISMVFDKDVLATEEHEESKGIFEQSSRDKLDICDLSSKIEKIPSIFSRVSQNLEEKSKKIDIFGEDSDSSDEDLFLNASTKKGKVSGDAILPVKSGSVAKLTEKAEKSSIFSDKSESGSEDELFGKSSSKSGKKTVDKPSKKPSLFEDSDVDDMELFGAKSDKSRTGSGDSSSKGSVLNATVETKTVKMANIKKIENKKVTDFDPLSALQ